MHQRDHFLGNLSARVEDADTIRVTRVVPDRLTGRLTFSEMLLVAANPASEADILQCFILAAQEGLARLQLEHGRP